MVDATLESMVSYNIAELFNRFDVRTRGETGATGKLSGFLGEDLLLDVLAHALASEGGKPVRLLDTPHRDTREFEAAGHKRPKVRDLDAWLLIGREPVAVECKQWTSSSRNYASVPGDDHLVGDHSRREWAEGVEWHFAPDQPWDKVNKVALPLKPPAGAGNTSWPNIRRVLAVWTPVSRSGRSAFSSINARTLSGGTWEPVTVEVFSASLYLRYLRNRGETRLTPTFPQAEQLFGGLNALFKS